MAPFAELAQRVMDYCDELGKISQSLDYLDRRYLSQEHRQANELVSQWARLGNMHTWQDAAGNFWCRSSCEDINAPRFLIGSHLDTVPNGGKYDGMLGVVLPIVFMQYCHQHNITFPFHVDIIGFGDEEGTRFGSTLLGSRALTGKWQSEWAELRDVHNIKLAQALQTFGLSFDKVKNAQLSPDNILGYFEVHIEQGPVLEANDLPVGIVSAIAGARRFMFSLEGLAGHAGTVPMALRQDSLVAASEMIVAIEKKALQAGLVATIGKIENGPNGVNVISGNTRFSLDIRSDNDELRDQTVSDILDSCMNIAQRRGVNLSYEQTHSAPAVSCDERLQKELEHAIVAQNIVPMRLFSGAGHDAMAMADLCPVAMLFMRCDKGISHNPKEAICVEDVSATLAVFNDFMHKLSADSYSNNSEVA
ncbi:allantoate amidohydrolase [Agaribacter flavus]|uniref:Allantoate amidohydrolase n=1 Tax=Agaribacter flavus TaxID=1902781 RepID=A0ABV7FMN3_9ALTE